MKRRTVLRIRFGCMALMIFGAILYFKSDDILRAAAEMWYDTHSFDQQIRNAARKHDLDARLVKAVVFQESRFNPRAKGDAGEIGLMQILPRGAVKEWARIHRVAEPSESSLYSPELNLEIGCWYLSKGMKRWRSFDDRIALALAQYNAGPSRAVEWQPENPAGEVLPNIRIASTKHYVKKILERYDSYCRKSPFRD